MTFTRNEHQLPSVDIVHSPSTGMDGLAICGPHHPAPVYAMPFRKPAELRAIALDHNRILSVNRRSDVAEIATIDAVTGNILKRLDVEGIYPGCGLTGDRTRLYFYGGNPLLRVVDTQDLEVLSTFDQIPLKQFDGRLINSSDYYRIGDVPGKIFHSPEHEQRYFEHGEYAFRSKFEDHPIETQTGSILFPLKLEMMVYIEANNPIPTIGEPREPAQTGMRRSWACLICEVEIETGHCQVLGRVGSEPADDSAAKLDFRSDVKINLQEDGRSWVEIRNDKCIPLTAKSPNKLLPRLFFSTRRSPTFDAFAKQQAVTKIVVRDWTADGCNSALNEAAVRIEKSFNHLLWGQRLELAFVVNGVTWDEENFFRRLAEENFDVSQSLRRLVVSYLTAVLADPTIYSPSLRTGRDQPAMGPAMRALILIDPRQLDLVEAFFPCAIDESCPYCGQMLADYAHQHGWTSREALLLAISYLSNCDYRGPRGFEHLGVLDHASTFLTADEFVDLMFSSGHFDTTDGGSNHMLWDFLGCFDSGEPYVNSVIAAAQERIDYPALRPPPQ